MSMVFNFFAMPDEVISLWDWLGELPGMQFIETWSRPDQPSRRWAAYPAEELRKAEGSFGVAAWPSRVGGEPIARQTIFEPEVACQIGGQGRTELATPARVRFSYLSPPREGDIGPTELVYETENLARKSRLFPPEQIESVDWSAMQKVIATIRKEIRKRAIANWRATPVLPGVAHHLDRSGAKLWLWGPTGTI